MSRTTVPRSNNVPALIVAALLLPVLVGCERFTPAVADVADAADLAGGLADSADHDDVVFELEALERALRPAVQERALRGERRALGADPVAVAVLPDASLAVLLRGHDTLLLLGGPQRVRSYASDGPAAAMAVDGDVVVFASASSGLVQRVQHDVATSLLAPVDGVTALAARDGLVDVGGVDGDVVTLRGAEVIGRCPVGLGLSSLVRLPHHLVALSSLAHVVAVLPLDDDGAPRCLDARLERFDGLLFSLVAEEGKDGSVDVVVSGVEDHPLDRRGGSFGNVDSFAYGLRFAAGDDVARVWETNLSAVGVVTGVALLAIDTRLLIVGKGSGGEAVLDRRTGRVLEVGSRAPGVVATALDGHGRLVAANVLDDVVTVDGVVWPFPRDGARDGRDEERLGEKLVFTTMLGPRQRSDGPLSRFTCETCHLGGGADGRVHATGRIDDDGHQVTATTKPLSGLFQNPPLFTRGMDRSVSVMVHAEVKVANRNSAQHPWFAVDTHSPAQLRRAMVAFFAGFAAAENGRARDRLRSSPAGGDGPQLDDDEARGWRVFQTRCLSCHAARVFADDPASQLDPARDDVVTALLRGALVFGRDGCEDTGVRPKVHPEGARPSSLRGVSRKVPLLTNGGAPDLAALLAQVRLVPAASSSSNSERFTHQGDKGRALSVDEQRALLAFLRLL